MRLLRRARTSCPAVSILTILKRNSPCSFIVEEEQKKNDVSRSVPSMELRDRGARLQSVRQTPRRALSRKSHAFADIQVDHPELLAARRVGDGNLVDGGAPLLHHGFAQPLGIAFAGFRKLD